MIDGAPQKDTADYARRLPISGHWFFFGPQGLRAGWSLLIFAALCTVLIIVGGFLVGPFLHLQFGVPIAPPAGLLLELSQLVPVVIATWIMAVLERRPVMFYGFQGSARVLRFVSGIVWGFVAISAVVLVLHSRGYLSLDGRTMGGVIALKYAASWGIVFFCVGLCEEAMIRGYAQFTMTRGIGFWWGAILLAGLFAVMHGSNGGESPMGLAGVAAISVVFCLSLWYTGSLWWAVGFHAAWDWGQSYFYGTADSGLVAQGHLFGEHAVGPALWSGGATGPEGSVIVLPLLLVIVLAMGLWWGRRVRSPFAGRGWRPGPLPGSTATAGAIQARN
ncbi:MAG TPA: type II CAAX endopeptidase family protein [Acidobacteriaceae bacterium]|nr:type II CAAX endopeptidase family protein [Acidobacteriaceae bacterium]